VFVLDALVETVVLIVLIWVWIFEVTPFRNANVVGLIELMDVVNERIARDVVPEKVVVEPVNDILVVFCSSAVVRVDSELLFVV
jgi:hypothetical protein